MWPRMLVVAVDRSGELCRGNKQQNNHQAEIVLELLDRVLFR